MELDDEEEKEDEVVYAGTQAPSSPEVKFTKEAAVPAGPAVSPDSEEEDDGVVVLMNSRPLNRR